MEKKRRPRIPKPGTGFPLKERPNSFFPNDESETPDEQHFEKKSSQENNDFENEQKSFENRQSSLEKPENPLGKDNPDEPFGKKPFQPDRPFGPDRPRFGDQDRPRYNQDRGDRGGFQDRNRGGFQDRPRFGGDQDRPRSGDQDRPRYNQDRGDRSGFQDRPRYGDQDRPRFGGDQDRPRSGDQDRPRYNQDRGDRGGFQDRPRYGDQDRPRFSGDQDRSRSGDQDRPRYNQDRPGYQDRPRYGDQDRPRFGGDQNRPRSGDQDRPRYNQDRPGYQDRPRYGDQDRPRYNQDRPGGYQDRNRGEGGGFQDRPRYGDQDRPRYNQDRPGGYQDRNRGEGGGFQDRRPYQKGGGFGKPGGKKPFGKRPFRKEPDFQVERKPKPNLPSGEGMPLNKYLAHCGLASRRKAVEFIEQGKVTVNGELKSEPYYRVQPGDVILCDGQPMQIQERMLYVLLNKPKNVITTTDDDHGRVTVLDIVDPHFPERIYPVGRLDRDTTGLILLTNDGDLAQKLAHPSHNIHKQYRIGLDRSLTNADYDRLVAGLELEDGPVPVNWVRYAEDHPDHDVVELEITIGRNRIVRRMFESMGYRVRKLDRFYFAGLTKKDLPRGSFRELTQREIIMLKHFTGHPVGGKRFRKKEDGSLEKVEDDAMEPGEFDENDFVNLSEDAINDDVVNDQPGRDE